MRAPPHLLEAVDRLVERLSLLGIAPRDSGRMMIIPSGLSLGQIELAGQVAREQGFVGVRVAEPIPKQPDLAALAAAVRQHPDPIERFGKSKPKKARRVRKWKVRR